MTQDQIAMTVFIAAGGTIAFFIGKFKIAEWKSNRETKQMKQETTKDELDVNGGGCLIMAVVLLFGLFQIFIGLAGIEDEFGFWWMIAAIAALSIARLTFPISIGVFYYAVNQWDWDWYWAALFAFPMVALQVIAYSADAITSVMKMFRNR
nr:MAG TPA: hypothetical protein [Caudoviricetes sp.]DAY17970.1 MAG TPA: hypothetical protein [Caudoviricetes sp.]